MCAAAERERRLALPRAGRDDHERRRLEPEQQLVEVVVAGGHADDRRVAVVAALELVHRLLEHRVERLQRVGDAALGDLEDQRLGAVECLVDVVGARRSAISWMSPAAPMRRRSIASSATICA